MFDQAPITTEELDFIAAGVEQELHGKTEPMIRVECAWCRKPMSGPHDAQIISHGICEPCQEKELADLAEYGETPPVNEVFWPDLDDVGPEMI